MLEVQRVNVTLHDIAKDGFRDIFLKWVYRHQNIIKCDCRYFEKVLDRQNYEEHTTYMLQRVLPNNCDV